MVLQQWCVDIFKEREGIRLPSSQGIRPSEPLPVFDGGVA